MKTIDLGNVFGGASERFINECTGKDARLHYETMKTLMVENKSEAPGFKRRVVESIGHLCHWPLPPTKR